MKKNSSGLVLPILTVALLTPGCASTVSGEHKTASPTIVTTQQIILQKPVCAAGGPTPRTAFFLTISGGGSRAAVFGARVLSELKHFDGVDLASRVDMISAVSGGSLAAALYGISREDGLGDSWRSIWSDELISERLTANLKVDMATQLANPMFLGGYLFGHKNRTDTLVAALDSVVLGESRSGRHLNLGDLSSERPQIVINSTVATKDDSTAFRPRPFGSLFTFSPADLDSIGVDYASMPISRAVAASAAFPGLLSPVVLNRFQLGATEQERGEPKYLHLFDGGNVDNLGLLAVKRALIEDNHRLLTDCDQVVVLTVDAFGLQGMHRDDVASMRSVSGIVLDDNTLFSAFDALLAANRTRLLAEFKSRKFTPPADSAQCRKDGLPSQVCSGGVRVNWDQANSLLNRKLLFIHLSFDSEELPYPPTVIVCRGAYEEGRHSDCDIPPVDRDMHFNELRALRLRLKQIPTTFGLSREEHSDITSFSKLLFTPHNKCLAHLREMLLSGAVVHDVEFYTEATNSCDETSSFTEEKMARRRSRAEAFGDWIPLDGSPIKIKKQSVQQQTTYIPLKTVEEREAFWSEVLKHYGRGN
jgi:predicted acylesterase/phospholipase RssA